VLLILKEVLLDEELLCLTTKKVIALLNQVSELQEWLLLKQEELQETD
jgi:hypothetical protein